MNGGKWIISKNILGYEITLSLFIWNKKKADKAKKRIKKFIQVNEYGFIF